jgi:hypothetical protein
MMAQAPANASSCASLRMLQQASLPFKTSDEVVEAADSILRTFPVDAYPFLTEMAVKHVLQPGYDYAYEFEFGLDLILEGLERVRETL